MQRQPLPPFNRDSALAKVKAAEDAWDHQRYKEGEDWPKEVTGEHPEKEKQVPFGGGFWMAVFILLCFLVLAQR